MTPNKALLQALDRFYNVQEIQYIRRWLIDERDKAMAAAIKAEGNADVQRGRARALMELVEIIETAPQALKRLETRDGKKHSGKPGYPGSGSQSR